MAAPETVLRLVERFQDAAPAYRSGLYKETEARQEFIDPLFEQIRASYGTGRDGGTQNLAHRIRAVVLVRVTRAAALVSPAYDTGLTEEEVVSQWDAYRHALRGQRATRLTATG